MFADTSYKALLAALLVASMATVLTSTAAAGPAEASGTANISVVDKAEFSQQDAVQFTALQKPDDGENQLVATHDPDNFTNGDYDDVELLEDTSLKGLFEIEGVAASSVQFSLNASDFEDPSISLDDVFVEDVQDEQVDGSTDTAGGIGGAVTIDEEASAGVHAAEVEVTVDHE